jgi:hypothetical protein
VVLPHAAELASQRPTPRFTYASPTRPPEPFTGIIVDASGVSASPAMAPKLLVLKELKAAVSVEHVELATAQEIGIVEYAGSVERAKALIERIGVRPLVVTAVSSHGATGSDLVISAEDGGRVAGADPDGALVRSCRVIFAGDPFI